MSLARPTTILHVSDLHFREVSRREFDAIWKAFEARISWLKQEYDNIDFVCMTGDFVYAADEVSSYGILLQEYFLPFFDSIGCHNRVMFCPGNHDASRDYVSGKLIEHHSLREALGAGAPPSSSELLEVQEQKFDAFLKHFGALESTSRVSGTSPLHPIYYDKDHDMGFACLNSALLTVTGINKESDERKLYVGIDELELALETGPTPSQWIFLMHHPLDWLDRESQASLERLISARNALLLHGHMHEGRPSSREDVFGSYFYHQAGALYSKDPDRFNGYSILRLLPGYPHVEVNLQSYFPIRRAFDSAVEICAGGQFYSSKAAKDFWRSPPIPTNIASLRTWINTTVLAFLVDESRDPMADRPLADIFVEPPLQHVTPDTLEISSPQKASRATLDDLLAGGSNLLFLGDSESSKTTLLRAAAVRILQILPDDQPCTLPVVVSFSAFSNNATNALRSIRNVLPEGIPSDWNTRRLAEQGLLTILIDDFNSSDVATCKVLIEFMKRYSANRYILTGERKFQSAISPALSIDLPVPINVVEILPLKSAQVRALVSKWKGISSEAAESLQRKIIEDTVAINLPLTGNNVAILIQLDEVPEIIRPVNRAALVERYIELLLRKHSLTELLQAKFDFRNKTHFLAWIAEKMVFAETYAVDSAWLDEATTAYVKKFELDIPVRKWIEEFLFARILRYENAQYSFRFRVFLEYFIAQGMNNNPELFAFVMDIRRYLSFVNEIDFYAGITRSDEKLLEMVAERFLAMRERADVGWSFDVSKLNDLPAPRVSKAHPESLFEKIEGRLQLPPPTLEELDSAFDGELPKALGQDQRVQRRKLREEADARFEMDQIINGLFLYSRLVRSTELIGGAAKRKHIDMVLTIWAEFWFLGMTLIPALAKSRKVQLAGITFAVAAPKEMSAEQLGYDLYASMPVNYSRAVYQQMGSEKLRLQLETGNSPADKTGAVTFLKRALSLDLRTPQALNLVKGAFLEFGRGTYLHLAMLAKLRRWWMSNSLLPKEHDQVVNMLAGEIGSKPGSSGHAERSRHRENLIRDELVLSIRRQHEDGDLPPDGS